MLNKKIKILIADDHELFRNGIVEILSSEYFIEIIDEAVDGKDFINKFKLHLPDISLIDISMPVCSGFEAVKQLREEGYKNKLLFLSMYDTEDYIYTAYRAGGNGLVSKNSSKSELMSAIELLYSNDYYFNGMIGNELNIYLKELEVIYAVKDKSRLLSKTEQEVLALIAEGLTSIEIAGKLFISKRTVDAHRRNIGHKLQIHNSNDMLIYARENFINNKKNF